MQTYPEIIFLPFLWLQTNSSYNGGPVASNIYIRQSLVLPGLDHFPDLSATVRRWAVAFKQSSVGPTGLEVPLTPFTPLNR